MNNKLFEQEINECVIVYDYTRKLNLKKISENELLINLFAIRYAKNTLYSLNRKHCIIHTFISDTDELIKELNIISKEISKIIINKKYGE